jgi:hypothetical protein
MSLKIYDFDPSVSGDPTVSPGTFVWAKCGRFRTAPERPFYPLLARFLVFTVRRKETSIAFVAEITGAIWTITTWDIADARRTAEFFMKHIIYENGICIEIVSDRDSKFTSKMWQDFNAALGITLNLSSSRHQSTDGQTERAIAHIEELIRFELIRFDICSIVLDSTIYTSNIVQVLSI